jgi:hypothetical protein
MQSGDACAGHHVRAVCRLARQLQRQPTTLRRGGRHLAAAYAVRVTLFLFSSGAYLRSFSISLVSQQIGGGGMHVEGGASRASSVLPRPFNADGVRRRQAPRGLRRQVAFCFLPSTLTLLKCRYKKFYIYQYL